MKYLVMECHLSHAIVLSDDGKFLKVANMRYEVGQTVENVVEMQIPEVQTETKSRPRWIAPLVSIAACLVLVVTMMFFQAPYASVYLTINPEVRIDVNRNDIVVGAEGVNADGATLLEGYDYQKKALDLVMDELVDRAIDMGYLSDGGTVTLTLDADDEWVVSHSNSLGTHLNEHLTEKISVTIEITSRHAQETQPSQEIVIPIEPGYNDTDYGTEAPSQAPTQSVLDTDYGPNNDGVTDYDTPDDGDDITDDDGDSNYNENNTDNGDSSYESNDDSDDDDD